MASSTADRIYFKGLNGIRAIAALSVVIVHTGQYLYLFGLQPDERYKWHWQSYAVTLFFVLSGYLITYLLLEEKARTTTIFLRGFYLRRILRIWPLYYLIVIITVILHEFYPATGIPEVPASSLIMYAFLLANVVLVMGTALTPLGPLWSIGVEEQFYALWPLIIKKSSNVARMLWMVIVIYLAVKVAIIPLHNQQLSALVAETRIDCMAIGGLGAVLLRQRGTLLRYLYSNIAQLLCWAIVVYSTMYRPIHIRSTINHELYSVVFIIIILNVSTNKASLINLELPIFDFMGKISYGLYMYHLLIIFLMSTALKPYLSQVWSCNVLIYVSVIALTTIAAYFSYHYFELPFLNIKERYAVVLSQSSGETN
jgi:peptidoglycan/LPS O-acetylase OafA/YrhL